ncbi:hypothetical protein SDC9_105827 [bioreactor metagenome]|uniref:HTH cro/C1-type domain-containing protein n=1 Tax=bioreactor metagenome TaxID=1076179 RepID=A0A645B0M7_9ZZZZ|nr:helix-turn-helix transcriptional regulator [Oscillospiraceae bacterium]
MDEKKVGTRIAKLRAEHKMTQLELAAKLGVSDKSISKWEVGGCYPDVTLFPQIADLFNVTVDYIIRGTPRTVQHFFTGDFGFSETKVNDEFLSNGWKIINVTIATGSKENLFALVMEKTEFEE